MATETQRPVLPHELAVAHDERHSYVQRMHSLVGPDAYIIPSTFQRPTPNLLLRVVQREQYGREFSRQKRLSTAGTPAPPESALEPPCQICLVTAADTHRARRDELRRLLAPVTRWGEDASSPSEQRAVADGRQRSPRASPRPRAGSPPRRRWTSAELAADDEQEDSAALAARIQQQLGSFRAPLTYQHFLMSTSYLERLRRQQQRQHRANGRELAGQIHEQRRVLEHSQVLLGGAGFERLDVRADLHDLAREGNAQAEGAHGR